MELSQAPVADAGNVWVNESVEPLEGWRDDYKGKFGQAEDLRTSIKIR